MLDKFFPVEGSRFLFFLHDAPASICIDSKGIQNNSNGMLCSYCCIFYVYVYIYIIYMYIHIDALDYIYE